MKKKGKWEIIDLTFDGSLLTVAPQADMIYELDDLKRFNEYVKSFTEYNSNGKKFLVISDFREHHLQLSQELLRWAATSDEVTGVKIAEAILIKYLPNRLVAGFYIKMLKPRIPTKIFKKRSDAVLWLEKFV